MLAWQNLQKRNLFKPSNPEGKHQNTT